MFYTVDKVAEMLGLHHKTIRKFITEGKLRASKVGKQWRISGHDLSSFMENNNVKMSNKTEGGDTNIIFSNDEIDIKKRNSKINVSTVIDINEVDMDEYRRISNMLLAVMNSNDSKMGNSTINIKHYKEENNLKVMLWGDAEFIKEMLDLVSIIIQNRDM